MANNLLFIVDGETGEKFCLAKTLGDGWYVAAKDNNADEFVNSLNDWLDLRDVGSSYGNSGEVVATKLQLVSDAEDPGPSASP